MQMPPNRIRNHGNMTEASGDMDAMLSSKPLFHVGGKLKKKPPMVAAPITSTQTMHAVLHHIGAIIHIYLLRQIFHQLGLFCVGVEFSGTVHCTGQNQELSLDGLNRHGKLKYSWAVGLGPFKPGQIVRQ